jgi:GH25 family lysozyme M1 (1,4-beta-N-acetylmuramidase)
MVPFHRALGALVTAARIKFSAELLGLFGSALLLIGVTAQAGAQSLVFGFDSSSAQNPIYDWAQVPLNPITDKTSWLSQYSGSPVSFVMLRASRGNPNDLAGAPAACAYADPVFNGPQSYNARGAAAAGLLVGAYHFATMYNQTTGQSTSPVGEANYFVSVAGPWIKPGNMRPFLDIEDDPTNNCGGQLRLEDFSGLVSWVDTWMQQVKNSTGVTPIIYASRYYAENYLAPLASAPYNNGKGYELWLSESQTNPSTPPNVPPWTVDAVQWDTQNGSGYVSGGPNGAPVNVDLDAFQGTYSQFQITLVIQNTSGAPVIAQQPLGQLAAAGQTATFTASASGTPSPTVQWQQSTNGGTSFENISGATRAR